MVPLNGVTVCVEYDDILRLTLPRNVRHFKECVVVTSPEDARTAEVVRSVPGVRLFQTDAFTRGGDMFNKGRALEEGLDVLGRSGWILAWDADIVLPDAFSLKRLDKNVLYSAPRRLVLDVPPSLVGDWTRHELTWDPPGMGYFQLFHANAEAAQARPWYSTDCGHAGCSDWYFAAKFEEREWLPFEVLHIGPRNENWFGRVAPRLDGRRVENTDNRRARMAEFHRLTKAQQASPNEATESVLDER